MHGKRKWTQWTACHLYLSYVQISARGIILTSNPSPKSLHVANRVPTKSFLTKASLAPMINLSKNVAHYQQNRILLVATNLLHRQPPQMALKMSEPMNLNTYLA